jgi:formyltetrahydrofolate deformylase
MTWDIHGERDRVKALVLVSRADHCLNDILYRTRTGHLKLEIVQVVSNHTDCQALVAQAGLPFVHLPVTPDTKTAQEEKIANLIDETGAELVVLARYMQVLSNGLCRRYEGRIINIHHSFLPGFKGAKPYHQAWERGVKIIGATAHFVTADLDEGPIIEQQTTRIDHAMTPEKLQVLGQDIEAQVLSRALAFYADRRIFLHGNRTVIL